MRTPILILLLFSCLLIKAQTTAIDDNNFQQAINTCLTIDPADGMCSTSEYGAMPDWDVSNVTTMSEAFKSKSNFNGDISRWNVSNVTNMGNMFYQATSFNQDISSWNVSSVTEMTAMFYGASAFNADLSGWNVNAVTSMGYTFYEALAFNANLSNWNVSSVTNMTGMFNDSGLSLTNYDALLNGWSTQTVQQGVTLGAAGIKFCNGEDARQKLKTDDNWTIIDGDINCVRSLGDYPAATITTTGGNTNVTPNAVPNVISRIFAYTNTSFKGELKVNLSTGVVNIINAYPAGTYTVTVDARDGLLKTFILTVGNPNCSSSPTLPSPDFIVTGNEKTPYGNRIGDFNNDGHLDYVTFNDTEYEDYNFKLINIYLGDGMGGFEYNNENHRSGKGDLESYRSDIIVDDFTGDGNLDVATYYGIHCSYNRPAHYINVYKGDGAGKLTLIHENNFYLDQNCDNGKPILKSLDLNNNGIKDLVLARFSNSNTSQENSTYFLGNGRGGFGNQNYFDETGNMATGDFNQDGKADLFINNKLIINNVTTSIDAQSAIPGNYLLDAVVGDFNDDGDQDLVCLNEDSRLFVLLGTNITNDATFGSPHEIVVDPSTLAIVVGDQNGDGYQDIITGGLNNVTIYYGNGDGAFGSSISLAVTGQVYTLSLADLNEDGKIDLFVNETALILETPKMKVLGRGRAMVNGSIAPTKANNTDFEGIVNGTTKNNQFTITNIGEATLSSIEITGADAASFSITGIDLSSPINLTTNGSKTFNVTFNPALFAEGIKRATVSVIYSDSSCFPIEFDVQGTSLICSSGTLAAPTKMALTSEGHALSIAHGDFNEDGNQDVGVLFLSDLEPDVVSINLGDGNGGFVESTKVPLEVGNNHKLHDFQSGSLEYIKIKVGDFNGDGHLDLVIPTFDSKITLLYGDGSGNFPTKKDIPLIINTSHKSTEVTVGEFNGDGIPDFGVEILGAITNIVLSNGSASYTVSTLTIPIDEYNAPYDYYSRAMVIEDFDKDGFQDIVANGGTSADYMGDIIFLKGNGDGTFTKGNSRRLEHHWAHFSSTLDFNKDGNLDIMVITPSYVYIYTGDGTGNFVKTPDVILWDFAMNMSVGDLNGDDNIDLIIPTYDVLSVWYGDATSGFGNETQYGYTEEKGWYSGSSIADFNNDGVQDVIVSHNFLGVYVYLGDKGGEINLQGNANNIVSGDTTPASSDTTHFDDALINTPITNTYTIENTGPASLIIHSVASSGTNAADFVVSDIALPVTIAPGTNRTFKLTFTSSTTGTKTATVIINNDDCDEGTYTYAVKGSVECGGLPIAEITNNTGVTELTCNEPSINVTATGGDTYLWDNGLGSTATASIIAPGTYTVTVTSANGCNDMKSIVITEDKTIPTAGVINNTGATELTCTHPSISVTATGGNTYVWDNGLGNSDTVTITTPGTYIVTVTTTNGCTDTESIIITGDQNYTPTTFTYNNGWSPSDPSGTAVLCDKIIIAAGDVTIASNTNFNTLTVAPGASLTVVAGVTITSFTSITLESTSTSYSSLLLNGTIDGTVHYNRFVNSYTNDAINNDNDLVSAPLTGETFGSFAAANANLLASGSLRAFAPFDKDTGSYTNYDTAINSGSSIAAGTGYRVATNDGATVTFTGEVQTGNVTVNIVDAGPNYADWNLIGNPYPSYVSASDFLNYEVATGVTNLSLLENASGIYGYDGDGTDGWDIITLANVGSRLLAPGQGFFVAADANDVAAHDLVFAPSMRRTGNSDDFISGRADNTLLFLKLKASTTDTNYKTAFYFNDNAGKALDAGYDAVIMGGSAPDFALYSHLVEENTGLPIALQALGTTDLSNITIPIGVNAKAGVPLTFGISASNLPAGVAVYLEDTLHNTTTLLTNSNYVVTPESNLEGTGRFYLNITEKSLSTDLTTKDYLQIYTVNSLKQIVIKGPLQGATSASVYDMKGLLVSRQNLDASRTSNTIDVRSISDGVYVVKLENNQLLKTQKVIIK
jgi:surface protein